MLDIFETYGLRAKHYDALMSDASRRNLTPKEKKFCDTFTAMLLEEKTEPEMIEAWQEWMNEENPEQPASLA